MGDPTQAGDPVGNLMKPGFLQTGEEGFPLD